MKKRRKYLLFRGYLDDGERILHIAHRHLIIFKLEAVKPFFFGILVPLFLYFLFPQLIFVFALWAFIGFLGVLYVFLDWYYDAWLFTNVGVIDIERNGLLDITNTRIEYHMVEGIAYQIKGWLPTIFNYGDITIDKIGARTSVILKDASHPRRLERILNKFQEKYVYERSVRDHHALKDMLSDMIAYHVQNDKVKMQHPKKK